MSTVFFHGNQILRDENLTCSSGSGKLLVNLPNDQHESPKRKHRKYGS